MTEELFREDSYLKRIDARVTRVGDNALCFDRSIFYPQGGGQPGDTGYLIRRDGTRLRVVDTRKEQDTGEILHLLEEDTRLPGVGETLTQEIDWERRYRLMRMHSCMHLLCAVVPAGVTGGSVRDGSARLDFDLPEPPNKAALQQRCDHALVQFCIGRPVPEDQRPAFATGGRQFRHLTNDVYPVCRAVRPGWKNGLLGHCPLAEKKQAQQQADAIPAHRHQRLHRG